MTNKETADFLKDEYLALQKTVEDFDSRALTIKAWSVTFSAAAIGLAFKDKEALLLLVAAGSALVFWIVEALWKYRQRAFYPRIFAIEQWFREHCPDGPPFQILTEWRSEFAGGWADWKRDDPDRRLRPHLVPFFLGVMLPHLVVLIAGVVLYVGYGSKLEQAKKVSASTAAVPGIASEGGADPEIAPLLGFAPVARKVRRPDVKAIRAKTRVSQAKS